MAIDWIEIDIAPSAQVKLAWLTMYLLASKATVDQGNEFLADVKTMIQADYGIEVKTIGSD